LRSLIQQVCDGGNTAEALNNFRKRAHEYKTKRYV
jgi:hypothetical protein